MIDFHLRGLRIFSLVLLQGRCHVGLALVGLVLVGLVLLQGRGHVGLAEQQRHLLHRLHHLHHLLHLDISGSY